MKIDAKIEPVQPATEVKPARKFGNLPGSQFFNLLNHKRVKGKWRVRGTRRGSDSDTE